MAPGMSQTRDISPDNLGVLMLAHGLRHQRQVPDLVPSLSAGKHRHPRKGACFMEFASYLAGERWSDHPQCTHPLLAGLARLVNDHLTDEGRDGLIVLIPRVIGLTGKDPRIDVAIALRAAATALPVVSEERQRALAFAMFTTEAVVTENSLEVSDALRERSRLALAQTPHAVKWARTFSRDFGRVPALKGFRRHAAPAMVRGAVVGIAEACVPDPDGRLHDLLEAAIEDSEALIPVSDRAHTVEPAREMADLER